MMISEMVQLFLDSRKRGVSGAKRRCAEATIKIYVYDVGKFADFMLTECSVLEYQKVTRLHMSKFIDHVESKKNSKEWSKATTLQIFRSMRTFFRWVDVDEDCQAEGLKGLQKYLPVIEKNPRRLDIPGKADLTKFKNMFDTGSKFGFRDYVATVLLMTNGMRISELCNLKMIDMMLDDGILLVEGKQGRRHVPVTKDTAKLLKAWLKRRTLCTQAKDSPYVFISKYKPKMSANGFGQSFRKHCKKFSLPRTTPHTLRHAFCTFYLEEGNMEKLRNITGHTTYAMLQDYLHLSVMGSKPAKDELEKCSLAAKV